MKDKFFLNVTFFLCTAVKTKTKVSLILICQFSCLSSCKYSDLIKVIYVKETVCSYPLTQQMKMSWGYPEKTRTNSWEHTVEETKCIWTNTNDLAHITACYYRYSKYLSGKKQLLSQLIQIQGENLTPSKAARSSGIRVPPLAHVTHSSFPSHPVTFLILRLSFILCNHT